MVKFKIKILIIKINKGYKIIAVSIIMDKNVIIKLQQLKTKFRTKTFQKLMLKKLNMKLQFIIKIYYQFRIFLQMFQVKKKVQFMQFWL